MTTSSDRGALFGELYLRSTRPFLNDTVTSAECEYLAARFTEANVSGLVLDLGCGHGRHLRGLSRLPVIGIDFDPLSLREAKTAAPVVCADFSRLPFTDEAFAAAYCWYNSLGTFEDAALPAVLAELSRCVRPGGWLIVQGTAPHVPPAQPTASWDGPLPDGSTLSERVRYDAVRRRDQLERRLTTPDGRMLSADFFIRYYGVSEWEALLEDAGFLVKWLHGAVDGSAFTTTSVDLIVGAQRRG